MREQGLEVQGRRKYFLKNGHDSHGPYEAKFFIAVADQETMDLIFLSLSNFKVYGLQILEFPKLGGEFWELKSI